MKFKIGDKVKIREDLVIDLFYGCDVFVSAMSEYCGKEATIANVYDNCLKAGVYSLDIDNGEWCWTDEMLEKLERLEKRLEMKKSDLQNGMIVECENGERYMVVRNFNEYTSFLSDRTRDVFLGISKDVAGYMPFSGYDEDLRLNHEDEFGYNIAKVGYSKHIGCPIDIHINWIWERDSLTEDEKAILRNLDKSWVYMARNKSGELCVATDDMFKKSYYWGTDGTMDSLCLFDHLFQFIKWEDDEPYVIDKLLEENGVER